MSTPDNFSDPTFLIIAVALAGLLIVLLLRTKRPETHVQQASQGAIIHHDARTIITVNVGRDRH